MRKSFVGFAHAFLWRCDQESKTYDDIDVQIYKRLVELDTRLGTTNSEQLYRCLRNTTRWDIIKV